MTDDRITARRGWIRALLTALGAAQLVLGFWALLAPRSFYGDFPTGQGWVAKAGAYDEHLLRDVGSLFLALGLLMLIAAVLLSRRLVLAAAAVYLVYAVPHVIFHAFNLQGFSTADAVSEMASLAASVIGPLAVLALALRQGGPPTLAPAVAGANGMRVAGVPASARSPVVRYAYWQSRRKLGTVAEPVTVFAHHPSLLAGYGIFELATERAGRVDARLKDLAVLRAATLSGCEWCIDLSSEEVRRHGVSDQQLAELPSYRESVRFSPLEKLVLDYASGMSRTPVEVSDELFARLREHFDEAQLVELTSVIALENYRARFNWAFGIPSQGFSEGAYCARPEPAAAGSTPSSASKDRLHSIPPP